MLTIALPTGSRSFGLGLLAILAAALCLSAPAAAQDRPVDEPYFVSPVKDGVVLRSDANGATYPVRALKGDMVLRVVRRGQDGQATYLGVEYPPGTPAMAPASDVVVESDGRTLTTVRPTALRHINLDIPTVEQSFIGVFFRRKLPIGTTLEMTEVLRDADGVIEAYVIRAPAGSVGWVLESETEGSTEKAYRAYMQLPPVEVESVTPEKTEETTVDEPVTEEAVDPVTEADPVAEHDTDVAIEDETPEAVDAAIAGDNEGDTTANDDTVVEAPVELPPHMETFRKLEDAYGLVNEEPLESAEFESLIDAYNHLDADIPDSAENRAVRYVVARRLAMLRLRRDFQNALFALDTLERPGSSFSGETEEALPSRYTVIGKLRRSVVYDGTNLPLMYRVMSLDSPTGRAGGRTMAYVKPDPKLDLDLKLNSVVGVVSKEKLDRDKLVNVLKPSRVDVLD